MKAATKKVAKQVQVIARIQFKCDHRKVVYLVRSSNGASQYETSLFDGTATNCTCKARGNCYHKTQLMALEVVRAEKAAEVARHNAEVASQFAAQVVPSWFVELVDAGTIVAPSHVETVSPKVVEIAESLDIPVAEVEAIAVIAAEHKREMTEGKHTDFELPIRSGRKPRKYATEMMEKQQHYASVKSQMAEIRERREAEAKGNLYKPYALMR